MKRKDIIHTYAKHSLLPMKELTGTLKYGEGRTGHPSDQSPNEPAVLEGTKEGSAKARGQEDRRMTGEIWLCRDLFLS